MRRSLALLVAAFALVLAAPAAAPADSFDDVYEHYRANGRIDPCAFTPQQLEQAKRQVPNDIEQYAPDFPEALDAALAARARGIECGRPPAPAQTQTQPAAPPAQPGATPPASPAPDTPVPGGQTPQPTPSPAPAQGVADQAIPAAAAARASDAGAPAALVLLAILGAILLTGLTAWGAARFWAWEPAWLQRTRHATAEAGWRAGASWAEFTDWVRMGR
jgi:hypothetical protein